eukprot:Colp12_sorted_trinity150504_noHs@17724
MPCGATASCLLPRAWQQLPALSASPQTMSSLARVMLARRDSFPQPRLAASTAQLLVACQVKSDPNSKSAARLMEAGNAVKRATETLVKSAQTSSVFQKQESVAIQAPSNMVMFMKKEQELQAEILRKEKELAQARINLSRLREQRYK